MELIELKFRGIAFVLNSHKVLIKYSILLVSMRLRETPVNIPNTMVKPRAAENTTLATAWEHKWMPDIFSDGSAKSTGGS